MSVNPRTRSAWKTLAFLMALLLTMFVGIGATVLWGDPKGQWTPKLGLDLEGGTQMVLEPIATGGASISDQQMAQAIDILRRRVDSTGVAEAEVSKLGDRSISVALPGAPTRQQTDALSRASQMRFRAVIAAQDVLPAAVPTPTPTGTGTPTGTATATPTGSATPTVSTSGTAAATPTTAAPTSAPATTAATTGSGNVRRLVDATSPAPTATATATPTATATVSPTATGSGTSSPTTSPTPTVEPQPYLPTPSRRDGKPVASDPSDYAWVTPQVQSAFLALDCSQPTATSNDDPALPLVACNSTGTEKYILGPAEVTGDMIDDASAGYSSTQSGALTSQVEVRLRFNGEGSDAFSKVTSRLFTYRNTDPTRNRFAAVLDGVVITAPGVVTPISGGEAQITGDFTLESGQELADQLKFGALPLSFKLLTNDKISPTVGGETLRIGIVAGLVGLLLVFLYSLFQYHALGLVTIASLIIAAIGSYGAVTLLGWGQNFRLSMAGITGLIVAIGVTADSFIVYFERVRDEVREGRSLQQAVQTGWSRAKRTILISDAVNFLAASVLYVLSDSTVKAFAFTLGLTTVLDVILVFLFTHPLLTVLSYTKFFGEGRKWSGFDPEHLGARKVRYAGRGRVSVPVASRNGGELA